MTAENDLPFVNVAAFCESLLTEKDDVQSAIRIIDRIQRPAGAPPPAGAFAFPVWYLLILRSGSVTGEHEITLTLDRPNGTSAKVMSQLAIFNGGGHGVSLAIRLAIQMEAEGIYWLRAAFDGKSLASSGLAYEVIQPQQVPE